MRVVILGSGRGSNAEAILQAQQAHGLCAAKVVQIFSDQPGAGILMLGERFGVPAAFIDPSPFKTKLEGDGEDRFIAAIRASSADLVVLAGFMRVLKEPMLTAFPHRIINLHPSLLPKFPGLEAWSQALAAGEKVTGCTVHYVDAGVDTGEIIAQREIPILPGDTAESLHARIQIAERELYPEVIAQFAAAKNPNVEARNPPATP